MIRFHLMSSPLKTNRRSLLHALSGFFGFNFFAKGSERSSDSSVPPSANRESVKREKTLCPSNQGKLSQRIRTKIKYDSLDRVVLRIDYRDEALVAKSIYEYRNP